MRSLDCFVLYTHILTCHGSSSNYDSDTLLILRAVHALKVYKYYVHRSSALNILFFLLYGHAKRSELSLNRDPFIERFHN